MSNFSFLELNVFHTNPPRKIIRQPPLLHVRKSSRQFRRTWPWPSAPLVEHKPLPSALLRDRLDRHERRRRPNGKDLREVSEFGEMNLFAGLSVQHEAKRGHKLTIRFSTPHPLAFAKARTLSLVTLSTMLPLFGTTSTNPRLVSSLRTPTKPDVENSSTSLCVRLSK